MTQIEKDIKRFIYSKEVSPSEIIWLLLGLPIKGTDGNKRHLKLNIAETILFGFGNSGIYLKTNEDGYINRRLTSSEDCLSKPFSNESSIVAYEKETCLKLIPQQGENSAHYIFEGNYSVGLTKTNYDRTIAQIYKELYVVQRQFRLQYHITLKHQRYHKFAFKRVIYQLNGKTSVISVRSLDPVTEKFDSPTQNTYDKPWKQKSISESKIIKKFSSNKLNEDYDQDIKIMTNITNIINITNKESNNHNHNHNQNGSSPIIESGSNHVRNDDEIQIDVFKRTLKPFIPNNSIVIDIPLSSAPTLLELTVRVANHLASVLKKQITNLILDFVKNSSGEYVLIEVLGFQCSGYGPEVKSNNDNNDNKNDRDIYGRVLKLSSRLKKKIEHFYKCRLNGTKYQRVKKDNNNNINNNNININNSSGNSNNNNNIYYDTETDSMNGDDSDYESYYNESDDENKNINDQLEKKALSEAITPQTLTCRMCTRKITPGSIRYLLTSIMIHSTVVHLRSRLPYDELPEFCRDRSSTMKTMQRLDDVSSSLCPPKLDVTEADLVTCETCYALYKGESHLMEIEHQLARFTRTSGINSVKFDARKALTKPLKSQSQPQLQSQLQLQKDIIQTSEVRLAVPRRQSVQGGNILARPTSAPLISNKSRLPLSTQSKSNSSLNSNTNSNVNVNINPLTIANSNLRSLNKLLSKSSSGLTPEILSSTGSGVVGNSIVPLTPKTDAKRETLLRDTFRAKNSPTRTLSKDFYQTASPLKRTLSSQSDIGDKKEKNILNQSQFNDHHHHHHHHNQQRNNNNNINNINNSMNTSSIQDISQEYPPISLIPIGRRVTRSDLVTQPLTLCRMMIALHKVTDLPVTFLDAYENFRVCYVSLGRRRDAPCMKNFTFTRNRANRFKNRNLMRTNTKVGRILEGIDESDSDSGTSSSHGSSLCSDPSSGFSEDEENGEEDEEKEEEDKKVDNNKSKSNDNNSDEDNEDNNSNSDSNSNNNSNNDDSKSNNTDNKSKSKRKEKENKDKNNNNNNLRKDSKTTPRKSENVVDGSNYPITRKTSLVIQKEKEKEKRKIDKINSKSSEEEDDDDDYNDEDDMDHDETEICVGALDVKYMRMSYFMVPGDAQDENNIFYNNFVTKSGRILVVLCAQLKRNAVIDERHWIIPDETKTSKAKAYKLRKEIYEIRKAAYSKSQSKRFHHHDIPEEKFIYDPRADKHKITDTGDHLPSDAIGYAYISIDQLKCNAVKRLDLGVPLTYAIKHLPKERSVPMLRAMVGIDRPVYPIDNWSLPYALVELYNEKHLYVAEFEEQYTSTVPLPPEWLNVDIEKSAQRRQPLTQTYQADQGNNKNEIDYSEKLNTLVRAQIAADIDGHKRAPTLYVSAGRVERMTMTSQQQPIVKLEGIVDSEQKMERMDSSVWCLCIQVMQARHLSSKENIFAENRPIWICSYNFFGESVCIKGELLHDDFDEGVIYFGTTSKHLFKGSIDAVEAMLQNNPPILFEVEIVHLPQKSRTQTSGNILASNSLLLDLSSETNSAINLQKLNKNKTLEEKKCMSGSLQLDIQEERFIDITVQLQPKYVETNNSNFSLYPPYLNINVKLFRMGPHEETAQYNWLPPQTKLGDVISKCVTRVIAVEFGSKTVSNNHY